MRRVLLIGFFLMFGGISPASFAGPWPEKPLRLIVAYPGGGGLDFVARTVAQRLSEQISQSVIVENRSGASGSIGTDYVAKAAGDGYTFLMASPAEVIVGPAAGQKTPYDSVKDLVPIALIGETPLILAAHPSIPVKDLESFIAYSKLGTVQLSYGTPGSGSPMQFAGEALKAQTGARMLHIPYRGAAPALNDALGGQISMVIAGLPPVVPHVKAGAIRPLAVTTLKRSSLLPDVPSVSELPGLEGYRYSNWMTVFAPAKTPAAVVDRMRQELAKAVNQADIRERLLAAGVEPLGLVDAELESFLKDERTRYEKIAREGNIRFEN